MRAVDGEDLEAVALEVTHPAGDLCRGAVPLDPERVLVGGEPRFSLGELRSGTELNPGLAAEAAGGCQDVADDGNADEGGADHVQREPELEEEAPS